MNIELLYTINWEMGERSGPWLTALHNQMSNSVSFLFDSSRTATPDGTEVMIRQADKLS